MYIYTNIEIYIHLQIYSVVITVKNRYLFATLRDRHIIDIYIYTYRILNNNIIIIKYFIYLRYIYIYILLYFFLIIY